MELGSLVFWYVKGVLQKWPTDSRQINSALHAIIAMGIVVKLWEVEVGSGYLYGRSGIAECVDLWKFMSARLLSFCAAGL